MMNTSASTGLLLAAALASAGPAAGADRPALRQTDIDLVPEKASAAPDYYCTWNIQGYISSHTRDGSENIRSQMREENIFRDRTIGGRTYKAWVDHYAAVRKDLFFVLDDSWDTPLSVFDRYWSKDSGKSGQRPEYGLAILDQTRFPSFKGDNVARLRQLAQAVEKRGWKGLGGWVAANKCQLEPYRSMGEEEFWKARLAESQKAGVRYWKVDWGTYPGQNPMNSRNGDWRRDLTKWAKEVAPDVVIEHASFQGLANPRPGFVTFSPILRTYDVDNRVAVGQTIQRVAELLPYRAEAEGLGIVNCEDEPYIAAGLGCAIGIMRHPLQGPLPNGRPDTTFFDESPKGRRLKQRLTEVVRGVLWHRIALPFSVAADGQVDGASLEERWNDGGRRSKAPARVSRGMALPRVQDAGEDRPYVLASRYPTGQTAVVTMGRSLGDRYENVPVRVEIDAGKWKREVGIFGYYKELVINYEDLPNRPFRVLAQDLASNRACDISSGVARRGKQIVLPGELISRVGKMSNDGADDLSDPGLVLVIMPWYL